MRNTPPKHPLAYVLELRGWGVVEFAARVRRRGEEMNLNLATNRTTVYKWIEYGQTPDEKTQRVIADLLGLRAQHVEPDAWPLWLPVWEIVGLQRPWTLAGTVEALSDLVRSGHMDRRGFLTITGASLTALAANWADAPTAFAAAADGDKVTDTMLVSLEQRVESLRDLDAEMGGARLLEHARSDLALITTMIKNAHYTDVVGARLHSLAAQVSYQTGWAAYDSGLHSVGQQYYVAALRSARTAGDDELGAFVLAEMGVHASDGGYNRERGQLLETALHGREKSLSDLSRTYLYLHLAAARADEGEHRGASVALEKSVQLWDRVDDERPPWLQWFGESQINSTRGQAALRAGQAAQAASLLEASIGAAVPRDQAVRAGHLAEARLAGNDLDGALDAANRGVGLLEERVASTRAVGRLREFSGKLSPYGRYQRVREFNDRLKALPAAAVA
ncbi:transcriptional regulator [Streptomyces buecherae]|uniref:Transcriptional regulator n=2 Tax=Streptomyces buecherae TaxID=2763006 RepID=A0A7H8NI65_9ACTN|nr:transcriptional regulator [Streptomyces buecherae]QKW54229.1 transcriptional regulator [Streptomyces buecherae]